MKKIILALGFCTFASSAFAGNDDCVSFAKSSLLYKFYNNCPFTVLIRGKFGNGYEGLWGPLKPGHAESANPGSGFGNARWTYCQWSNSNPCTPPRM